MPTLRQVSLSPSDRPGTGQEGILSQPHEALKRANQVRSERYALRLKVRDGKLPIERLIMKPPTCIERMAIRELLRWPLRWQNKRASKLLGALGIQELKSVGDLEAYERRLLIRNLPTAS